MDASLALKAAVMGVVEGLTEFLPVSSTGHLIVTGRLLGFDHPQHKVFEVVIQAGAILAVAWYFRTRLLTAARGALAGETRPRRLLLGIGLAFLLFALVGLLTHQGIKAHLFNPATVAITTCLGGLAILLIERFKPAPRHEESDDLPWRIMLGIGLLQLAALVPGVSRSGATILGALCLAVGRRAATEFTFFLAIPTLGGACAYDFWRHRSEFDGEGLLLLGIGLVTAFATALAVVHWLLRFVSSHSFAVFAWYRLLAGLALAAAIALGWIAFEAF